MTVKKSNRKLAINYYLQYDAFEGGPVAPEKTVIDILNSIGKDINFFILELFARFGVKENKPFYDKLQNLISAKCKLTTLEKCLVDNLN